VTFDIDANGIVNVSAADKGTGQRWMAEENPVEICGISPGRMGFSMVIEWWI